MIRTTGMGRTAATLVAAGVLSLVLPLTASADPPSEWPRRAADVVALETASVRPDDRADRAAPPTAAADAAATAADGRDFGWADDALGFTLFVAALGVALVAMVYSHRRLRSA